MISRSSQFSAVVSAKCPRCRRGNIFRGPMYGLKLQKTNDICPHCGFRFEVEPGYFYAAMYVSYALNVLQMLLVGMVAFALLGDHRSPWLYISIIVGAIFLFAPFNYRYSRVILLHWLTPRVKYDPYYDKE